MAAPVDFVGSKLELRLSCSKLKDGDILSKSDPMVVLYTKTGQKWTEHSRTECIKNCLNPVFTKCIEIDYYFEELQKLKFTVYDIDNETDTLDDDDYLGTMECTLGEIVNDGIFTKPLTIKDKTHGTITINAEEVSNRNSLLKLRFNGVGLDKKDLFGKSDPYLEFSRENTNGTYSSVYRTQVIKNTLNPTWPPFDIDTKTLCNNSNERKIKVTCYDWDSDGSHDLIGSCSTSLNEILTAFNNKQKLLWELINPKKLNKRNYKNSGTITVEIIDVRKLYSFTDYIMGGCTINFTVGIDFTASNGDPRKPTSLHYINPLSPNEYLRALRAVGYICQDYDSDKMFPAFGFGGRIAGQVSHEFALNGIPTNPYCIGIEGIVSAYQQALYNVQLYGPTNMAPIINHVANFAEESSKNKDRRDYYILLILTDGEITDMSDTKRAIIRSSTLPMSIIIVGVGGCDFEKMVELDSDDQKLSVYGLVAERDIVQFVPFRKFAQDQTKLAKEVLAEIPTQLTEYMYSKGIVPLRSI